MSDKKKLIRKITMSVGGLKGLILALCFFSLYFCFAYSVMKTFNKSHFLTLPNSSSEQLDKPLLEVGIFNMKKEVDDYPNYLIYDDGRVWSKRTSMFLKFQMLETGYYRINMRNGFSSKNGKIHRLVAEAFIPNPENKPCVNHIDGNKLNNHVSNLEWCTHSENNKHAYDIGLKSVSDNFIAAVSGEKNFNSKKVVNTVTKEIFVTIKSAAESIGINQRYLAKMLRGEKNNKTVFEHYKQ